MSMSANREEPPKKLCSEARCISNILEQCISQLEIAAALPAVLCLNSVSPIEDQDLSRALRQHQTLAERLLQVEQEQGQERTIERAQLETDIRNSVRDVLRVVRARPDALFSLREKPEMGVGDSEGLFIRKLKMFHSFIVHSLLTNIEEELQLPLGKYLSSSFLMRMTLLSDEEAKKEEEEEEDALEEMDAEENSDIITQEANMQEKDAPPPADKQGLPQTKTLNPQLTSIQQELNQVNIQLNNLMLANRQAERLLQEKNEKVEMEIEYLLKHFDDEIEEIQTNLEQNELGYEKEDEEVRKLEKPFSLLEMECNKIQERQRLAEEKRIEELKELELKTKAALLAQAWWRGYTTRKALKNQSKSKTPKKGKGKGKRTK